MIVAFLLSAFSVFAQDSILRTNGDRYSVKILEIGINDVKYKKTSNLDGPLYTILKEELEEIVFENGSKEFFTIVPVVTKKFKRNDSEKIVFIKTTVGSDMHPTQDVWEKEIERFSGVKKTNNIEESDLIFEFNIKRAMGESRVSVVVYNTSDNKKIWESKRYRGTANIYNRMGASLDGIRKCISKGVLPFLEKGGF